MGLGSHRKGLIRIARTEAKSNPVTPSIIKNIRVMKSLIVAWWLATAPPQYDLMIKQQSMIVCSPVFTPKRKR
jgi:hypothetical protein